MNATAASSYLNEGSVINRANSAMLRIERIISDVSIPSEARLVLIAQVMASEPILTDSGTGACAARRRAARYHVA